MAHIETDIGIIPIKNWRAMARRDSNCIVITIQKFQTYAISYTSLKELQTIANQRRVSITKHATFLGVVIPCLECRGQCYFDWIENITKLNNKPNTVIYRRHVFFRFKRIHESPNRIKFDGVNIHLARNISPPKSYYCSKCHGSGIRLESFLGVMSK